jgi:hypothetical protein
MSDPVWEAVLETAAELESAVDSVDDDWRWQARHALDVILARFECCRADDLPARAVTALASAWLLALDAEEERLRALTENDDDA